MAEEIALLRDTIRANDGTNVANSAFVRRVEELISTFYDDITELIDLRLTDILDLFLIKVLYVNRHSRDAAMLAYLGRMLEGYLGASELNLSADGERRRFMPYLSDLVQETEAVGASTQSPEPGENAFERYRKYGDNALFISGIYPQALGRKRGGGVLGGAPLADSAYFISMGRRYYGMAAGHDAARWVNLRQTLLRLSAFFDVYVEALNEMSGRYVMGMDMRLIADKMLDAFSRYRTDGNDCDLASARTYAALLKLDGHQWPALEQRAVVADPRYY